MTPSKLDEFISKKEKERSAIDWDARKKQWLKAIDNLYGDVSKWLAPYVKEKKIEISTERKGIHEEKLGAYEADQLVLLIQGEKVILEPIGALIIGGRGRVDLKGKNGTIKLILTEKSTTGIRVEVITSDDSAPRKQDEMPKGMQSEELVWKLATPPPQVKFHPLTEESFIDILLKVIE